MNVYLVFLNDVGRNVSSCIEGCQMKTASTLMIRSFNCIRMAGPLYKEETEYIIREVTGEVPAARLLGNEKAP